MPNHDMDRVAVTSRATAELLASPGTGESAGQTHLISTRAKLSRRVIYQLYQLEESYEWNN